MDHGNPHTDTTSGSDPSLASASSKNPVISVVIVSDYNSTGTRDWHDVRECLEALSAQDIQEDVEFVLCEDARHQGSAPSDLTGILPALRVRYFPISHSYSLKNAGVAASNAPFIALLDADCRPSPNWLRCSLQTLRAHPLVAAVSGRTVYPGADRKERILALLARAYIDPGSHGLTSFLSQNGAVMRRDIYQRHPLPEDLGAFSSRIQSEAILRDGGELWFDPSICIVHEFEGWPMEADIRRNAGWGTVATRLNDKHMPYARLIGLGPCAIPAVWAGKLWNLWGDALRCHRGYGVRWFELPYAFFLGAYVSLLEIPGMWMAYRREPITDTAYR